MSAVIVKGIIISLSLAAAVGIALQSPEVKDWLEEQRRKLAELLRNVSEGLDPQTRREAEAFAYEGQMPSPREIEGMQSATAVATGMNLDENGASRRTNRQSSSNPIDAEERRRLGREYLARRNQELLDMKKKKDSEKGEAAGIVTSETGFPNGDKEPLAIREKANSVSSLDRLINDDGSLRIDEKRLSPTPATQSELPSHHDAEEKVRAPVAVRAMQAGSLFGNPFADEFAMSDSADLDRAATPKPPVPPKIALRSETPVAPVAVPAASVEDPPEQVPEDIPQELSYDEQLARALSISLAESEDASRKMLHRTMTEQEAFERAIQESLKDAKKPIQPEPASSPKGPLVDFSSDVTTSKPSTDPFRRLSNDDDLYYLTPSTTGVHSPHAVAGSSTHKSPVQYPNMAEYLDSFQARPQQSTEYEFPDVPTGSLISIPRAEAEQQAPEAISLPAQPAQPTSPTATLSPSLPPQDALSTGYHTESETEDFASLPDSTPQSEGSLIEIEDVDIDSMSDDDDGIRTPQSWSEVGSDVGDSERSESEAGDLVHV
ncbi:hypothetical protein C1H76_6780 [Elsinoe australis]|uniref:Uncharacterized protein n=1 Tax=Elsinoe australis TaxID=40998 RepID=A0A4U7AT88_9PEZI|nr:hypothetical protein C1H76_6780 [Elsinoe australis]